MLNRTIYRLPEVVARTGLSRSTFHDLIRKRKLPSQVNLGPRAVGWVENEILDRIVHLGAGQPLPQHTVQMAKVMLGKGAAVVCINCQQRLEF